MLLEFEKTSSSLSFTNCYWFRLSKELCKSLAHDRRECMIKSFDELGRAGYRARSPREQLILSCIHISHSKQICKCLKFQALIIIV